MVRTNRYKRPKVLCRRTELVTQRQESHFPATVVATKKASLEIGCVLSDVIHVMIHDLPGTGTPEPYQRATGPSQARTELNRVGGQPGLGNL